MDRLLEKALQTLFAKRATLMLIYFYRTIAWSCVCYKCLLWMIEEQTHIVNPTFSYKNLFGHYKVLIKLELIEVRRS